MRLVAGCVLLVFQGCATKSLQSPPSPRPELHRQAAEGALLRSQRAWDQLATGTPNGEAAAEYSAAVREFVGAMIGSAPPRKWIGEYKVPMPNGEAITVSLGGGTAPATYDPQRFDRILVAEPRLQDAVVPGSIRPGLGVPLLARIRETDRSDRINDERMGYPNHGQFIPLTAWIEFSRKTGRACRATLRLSDPRENSTVQIASKTMALAADFRAPAHAMLGTGNLASLAIKGLLNPDRFIPDRGVYLGEPYSPDKIPVIMTHGLISDSRIWENLATAIMADPLLGKRCQIWYFAYPTGEPVLNSARAFRSSLAEVRKFYDPKARDFANRDMVLVGHSMGGLLSRLLVTDSADDFYAAYFTKPIEQLAFRPTVKREIRNALYFQSTPGVTRAVFIATPHRGSDFADSPIGWLGRALIGLPRRSVRAVAEIVKLHEDALNPSVRRLRYLGATSVDTLSPQHPYFRALESRPITVPHHSIIGDRGKRNGPHSSDGMVNYSSSHLASAQSEAIISCDHACVEHPAIVEEVLRILRNHVARLKTLNRPTP